MKAFRLLFGLALAALGTLGLGAASVPFPPDLFLLSVGDAARGGAFFRAMLAGLLAGLLEDLLRTPPRLLGLHAFGKILIGYLFAAAAARFVAEKPSSFGALVAGAVVVESLVLSTLLTVFRGEPFVLPGALSLVARAVATGLAGVALQALTKFPWKVYLAGRRRRRLG